MNNQDLVKGTEKMRIKFIIISILLASCSEMGLPSFSSLRPYHVPIRQGNLVTPEMLEQVKLGMPAGQLRAILGTPLIQDPFHANRWDYYYSLKQGSKLEDKQRLTLYLENDKLVRIDDSHMPKQSVPTVPDAGVKDK